MSDRFPKMRTIFCIIFSLFYGTSSKTINVATNGIVTIQPLVEGEIEDILWKHNGNKMVEWDNKALIVSEYLQFKGRIKLDVKTGDVTILNMTKDDIGFYDADLIVQGKLINLKHRVEVTDPVTKAKVTCLSNATLHCEAEGDSLDYSWSGPGLQTAEMRGQTGPQISKENQDSVYTCVVNNTVSDSSVTYHASDCFTSGASNALIDSEYFKFKGRIKLDVKTGDVTILNMTKDDIGFYDADVIIRGKLINLKHRVEVTGNTQRIQKAKQNSKKGKKHRRSKIRISKGAKHRRSKIRIPRTIPDPVTKAKVTCLSNATLHCEAEGDFLDYSWSGPGLQTAEMRGQIGPQISKENQDAVYTCVVNNPVSDSSVTYHASDCFTSGDNQLILGVVCAVIGVIGAAGLGYYCYKKKSKGQKHTGKENKYETTGKIITNQKMEETVLLLPEKHQASSFAVSQKASDQSLNSVEGEPRVDVQGRVKQLEEMAAMSPTTCYVPMNVPRPLKESDSASKSDESADPDHHAKPSSGSPRLSAASAAAPTAPPATAPPAAASASAESTAAAASDEPTGVAASVPAAPAVPATVASAAATIPPAAAAAAPSPAKTAAEETSPPDATPAAIATAPPAPPAATTTTVSVTPPAATTTPTAATATIPAVAAAATAATATTTLAAAAANTPSAPKLDESADPDHHADLSSGSPRQSAPSVAALMDPPASASASASASAEPAAAAASAEPAAVAPSVPDATAAPAVPATVASPATTIPPAAAAAPSPAKTAAEETYPPATTTAPTAPPTATTAPMAPPTATTTPAAAAAPILAVAAAAAAATTPEAATATIPAVAAAAAAATATTTLIASAATTPSAPKPDASADPDHHANPSSGSPRDADHTFSDDSKSPLFHMRNVEGTCENERDTNTGTVKQNQRTINKSPSGSAGNVSTDATDTQSCERQDESVNVEDNSSGKPIITGSKATHTAATNTCDRPSDGVTGDVQDVKKRKKKRKGKKGGKKQGKGAVGI